MDELEKPLAQRIGIKQVSSTDTKQVKINIRRSSKYPRVTWGTLRYPMCAVVGGAPSVREHIDTLLRWPGDIFAINDTSRFLSDNSVPHYMLAIDGTKVPFRTGPLCMGALFSSRVDRVQFKQMKHLPIRVFDLTEDVDMGTIEGGSTAACRTPHLLLSMGYGGITYFGLDGSFEGDITHVSGKSESAHDNMVIIRVNNVDYVSHAGFMLQNEYLVGKFRRHPQLLHNASGGLLAAMLADETDTWSVIAVAEDLKKKYEKGGFFGWTKDYKGVPSWQSQQQGI